MVNYEAVYRGITPLGERPPWDIEEPQPFVVGLAESGRVRGAVLDAGCGTGEHALFLAARGHAVTGVDVSATAVEKARRKAAERGVTATFVAADAVALAGYAGEFDTVVDCGLLDACPPERHREYAAALHRACRPGAVVHLLELSAESAREMMRAFVGLGVPEEHLTGLPQLVAADLTRTFADGWREDWVGESAMVVRSPADGSRIEVPAVAGAYTRL